MGPLCAGLAKTYSISQHRCCNGLKGKNILDSSDSISTYTSFESKMVTDLILPHILILVSLPAMTGRMNTLYSYSQCCLIHVFHRVNLVFQCSEVMTG